MIAYYHIGFSFLKIFVSLHPDATSYHKQKDIHPYSRNFSKYLRACRILYEAGEPKGNDQDEHVSAKIHQPPQSKYRAEACLAHVQFFAR